MTVMLIQTQPLLSLDLLWMVQICDLCHAQSSMDDLIFITPESLMTEYFPSIMVMPREIISDSADETSIASPSF